MNFAKTRIGCQRKSELASGIIMKADSKGVKRSMKIRCIPAGVLVANRTNSSGVDAVERQVLKGVGKGCLAGGSAPFLQPKGVHEHVQILAIQMTCNALHPA